MKQEAAAHEAEDNKKKEAIEAKNIAEQLVYTSEKALKDAGDKVPAELRKSIEDKVSDLKRAKDNATPDLQAIKTATQALSDEIQKIGQYMKQDPNTEKNPLEDVMNNMKKNPGDSGEGGNVKDADYKEKK